MIIHDIEYHDKTNHKELSAYIDNLHLWFRFPSHFVIDKLDATCFVTAALLPSMLLGEDLTVDPPYFMSTELHNNLDKIQEIYNHWNPIFKLIRVDVNTASIDRVGAGIGSFFSSGVDGTYTLCRHEDDIQHLILINGFDFNMGNRTWRKMVEKNQTFASNIGKELVPIETNYKAFTVSVGIKRYANYGTCLASISQLLGLRKVFFSGSATYENLYPDGAHILLDPLWSTELTEVIHTGLSADRSKKLQLIKEFPEAIANLWVCWEDPTQNCGRCSKCIRTYVALRLNGITDFKFQYPVTIQDVRSLSIGDEHDCLFFSHFLDQAIEQNDRKLSKVLNTIIGKYKIKTFLLDMDRYYISGNLKKLQLYFRGPEKELIPLDIIPKYSDEDMARTAISILKDKCFVQKTAHVGSVYYRDKTFDEDGTM